MSYTGPSPRVSSASSRRRRRSRDRRTGRKAQAVAHPAAAGAEALAVRARPGFRRESGAGKSPPSARGGVFARLEGKPKLQFGQVRPTRAQPDAAKELPHPKSTEKELPHPKRVVVVHKPNDPNDHKELPHPKPAPKPRDPPAPPAKGARGDKEKPAKQRDALDDALDEELAKATKGKKGGRTKGGSDRQGAPSEPHKELPHPKPAAPAPGSEKPHPVPAPRPVSAPDSESAKQLPHPNKPPVPKGNKGRSPIPAPKPAANNTGGSSVGGRPGSRKARNGRCRRPQGTRRAGRRARRRARRRWAEEAEVSGDLAAGAGQGVAGSEDSRDGLRLTCEKSSKDYSETTRSENVYTALSSPSSYRTSRPGPRRFRRAC